MESLEALTELLGGAKVLGGTPKTWMDVVSRMRAGLPSQSLPRLMKSLRLTHEDLSETLGIPRRTLARRKEQAKLDPKESEAVVRLARVAVRAEDVLGDIEAALRWLRAPNRALGGRTPLSLLDTDLGAELVGDVLGRIEHGVAS